MSSQPYPNHYAPFAFLTNNRTRLLGVPLCFLIDFLLFVQSANSRRPVSRLGSGGGSFEQFVHPLSSSGAIFATRACRARREGVVFFMTAVSYDHFGGRSYFNLGIL
jgi:hypothetical protein